jgi:hypothetical protein
MSECKIKDLLDIYQKILGTKLTLFSYNVLYQKLRKLVKNRSLLLEDLIAFSTDDVLVREISEIFHYYDINTNILYTEYNFLFLDKNTRVIH